MLSDTGGALAGVTHLDRMYRREIRKETENKEEEEEEERKKELLFLFALFPF